MVGHGRLSGSCGGTRARSRGGIWLRSLESPGPGRVGACGGVRRDARLRGGDVREQLGRSRGTAARSRARPHGPLSCRAVLVRASRRGVCLAGELRELGVHGRESAGRGRQGVLGASAGEGARPGDELVGLELRDAVVEGAGGERGFVSQRTVGKRAVSREGMEEWDRAFPA